MSDDHSSHGHGHHDLPHFPPAEVKTTTAELDAMNIPLSYRTQCVDIFIPLWRCWTQKHGVPCEPLKHEWERCNDQLAEALRKARFAARAESKQN